MFTVSVALWLTLITVATNTIVIFTNTQTLKRMYDDV